MRKGHLIETLPFTPKNQVNTLIENRRAFTLNDFELSVFETYQASRLVPLQFDDFVIINMLKGKKVMHLQNKDIFDYYPGETLVLPSYTKLEIDFPDARLSDPTQCTALTVNSQKIDEVVNYLNEFSPKNNGAPGWHFHLHKFHLYNNEELARLTNKLFQVSVSSERHKDALADLTLKELLVRIMQTQGLMMLEEGDEKREDIVGYLTQFIRDNISERLNVDLLCIKTGLSKSSLFRLFKREFDISPMEFVILERIRFAKKLLRQKCSVKEACFSSGFSDVNYFVRIFKKKEGVTPGNYIFSI